MPDMEPAADKTASARPDLGVIRTALSAERTLMSWIRTSLAMIGFGFSIYKFRHALGTEERSPRQLGIVLAAMGTTSLALGIIQYTLVLRSLEGRRPGFAFYVACTVMAFGLLVLAGIVLRIGPFS
jgi:putative membrane protein